MIGQIPDHAACRDIPLENIGNHIAATEPQELR